MSPTPSNRDPERESTGGSGGHLRKLGARLTEKLQDKAKAALGGAIEKQGRAKAALGGAMER